MEETVRQRGADIREVPYSGDAERSVLGSMLLDSAALELALEQLKPDDFYNPTHATIFTAMRDLRAGGSVVDLVTLVDALENVGKLASVGDVDFLTELQQDVPSASNVQEYINIVEEKSVRRQLIRAGGAISNDGYREDTGLDGLLNDAERRIYDISMRKTQDTLVSAAEIVPDAFAEISELMERQGKLTGVNTGFYDLNRLTNGFQKSDLIIVAARPAMGKTAFALNIAQYAALHDNRVVAIFSLEMSSSQLVMRMLCTEASVDSQKIKTGTMDNDDTDRLMNVMDPMSRSGFYIDDTGGVSVADIRSKCRRLKARKGLDMIVIDYLQLMQSGGSGRKSDSRTQEVSDITRQLKLLARELDVPIVLLCQLNRGPETRQDHTPLIADLRESGSIEQDADLVILLYRPAVYDPNEDNTAQIIMAKNRHGPTGTVELVWQGEYTRYMNKAPEA